MKKDTDNSNIYKLKDLYGGNIKYKKERILINEKDISYDLLKRDDCIKNIYDIIVNCNPDKKFVISL